MKDLGGGPGVGVWTAGRPPRNMAAMIPDPRQAPGADRENQRFLQPRSWPASSPEPGSAALHSRLPALLHEPARLRPRWRCIRAWRRSTHETGAGSVRKRAIGHRRALIPAPAPPHAPVGAPVGANRAVGRSTCVEVSNAAFAPAGAPTWPLTLASGVELHSCLAALHA